MAVTITAELFGTIAPEPVTVAVSGLALTDSVAVYRECAGEPTELVRGATGLTTPSGTLVVNDVEPQLGRPLVYVAVVTKADGTSSQTSAPAVTVTDPGRHVLSDPFTGRGVFVDVIATADERATPLRASVVRPVGRARPVALVDVRQDDEGELAAYTRDRVETAQLKELLANGGPVVSRHPNTGADIPGTEVLLFLDVKRSRRSRSGDRTWSLPFLVVDSPDPTVPVALVDLDDLATYYVGETLADIAVDFPGTLLDLARSDLGTA